MWALSFTTIRFQPTLFNGRSNTGRLVLGLKTCVDDAGDADYRRLAVEKTEAFTSFLDAVPPAQRHSRDNHGPENRPLA